MSLDLLPPPSSSFLTDWDAFTEAHPWSPLSRPVDIPMDIAPPTPPPLTRVGTPAKERQKGGRKPKDPPGVVDLSVFDILNLFRRRWFLSRAHLVTQVISAQKAEDGKLSWVEFPPPFHSHLVKEAAKAAKLPSCEQQCGGCGRKFTSRKTVKKHKCTATKVASGTEKIVERPVSKPKPPIQVRKQPQPAPPPPAPPVLVLLGPRPVLPMPSNTTAAPSVTGVLGGRSFQFSFLGTPGTAYHHYEMWDAYRAVHGRRPGALDRIEMNRLGTAYFGVENPRKRRYNVVLMIWCFGGFGPADKTDHVAYFCAIDELWGGNGNGDMITPLNYFFHKLPGNIFFADFVLLETVEELLAVLVKHKYNTNRTFVVQECDIQLGGDGSGKSVSKVLRSVAKTDEEKEVLSAIRSIINGIITGSVDEAIVVAKCKTQAERMCKVNRKLTSPPDWLWARMLICHVQWADIHMNQVSDEGIGLIVRAALRYVPLLGGRPFASHTHTHVLRAFLKGAEDHIMKEGDDA
ncbi:hypothetical protein EI94DRAFT_1810557 [Lactarius quietus]|nr:hypothetical protein EI94DRAFT_1810557 [Lactarius quietus]